LYFILNLVIDIGNSVSKGAVFDRQSCIYMLTRDIIRASDIQALLAEYPDISHTIISTVRNEQPSFAGLLQERGISVLHLDHLTPLPIRNSYGSKETLGYDRIAAAVEASAKFPGQDILIIDMGTAITIDFISSEKEFLGGNISPGLLMRFRSLHEFTGRLPLVEPAVQDALLGNDTELAIRAGVQNGIIFELDGYINEQKERYPRLQVLMTGGDAVFFDKKLKNSIFVDLNLNLFGLHRILQYNVDR
jgi:type III pantothenate kinase